MTEDWVGFEDSGTNSGITAGEGDWLDAANLGAWRHGQNDTDYVVAGLAFTPDYTTPALDVSAGKVLVSEQSASTVSDHGGESRDQRVTYAVEVSARSGVALTDSAVNEVFVNVDQSGEDAVSIVVTTDGSSPSEPSLKLGEVDTSADTSTETNRDPEASFAGVAFSGDLTASGTTVFDSANDHVPTSVLQASTVTVAGNSVGLGGSTSVAHADLSSIGSSDHHSRYSDSEAVTAVNNDTDHGSTASHNYFSGDHADLTGVGSSDHHSRYSDSEAVTAVNNDTDHGSTASHNYFSGSHNDLSNIAAGDHHIRYSDSEARGAVEAGNVTKVQFANAEHSNLANLGLAWDNSEGGGGMNGGLIVQDSGGQNAWVVHSSQGAYDIQKNGSDATGVINFKT
jgi:hypothetical protein